MTRFFISALALLGMGTMASAQFSVVKDGKVLFVLAEGTPDYITFENPMLCGGVIGEAVDMGLSVKWSSVNVGASSPEQSGNFYAWGETESKEDYSWETYKYRGTFIGDNKTTLEKADDAAAANWGGGWVMPSQADWEEIYYNCTYEWTTQNGVNGYLIKGTNGNSIFLPAAGYRSEGYLGYEGTRGYYWSSSLYEFDSYYGRGLYFYSGDFDPWSYGRYRYYGQSVRPVCPSAGNTNGHVAVDLGLPSGKLWADCNVGASTPEASGDYIAWGETEAKEYYGWSTYKHMQEGKSVWNFVNKYQAPDGQYGGIWYRFEKYSYDDNKTTLEKTDDAATANWGDNWRMPTAAEWEELYNNTTQTWTDDYEGTGVKGDILTSTKEGHEGASIFLPAAGYRNYGYLAYEGSCGFYWSSSLSEDNSCSGRVLYFLEGSFYDPWWSHDRFYGRSVRPVCPSAEP